MDEILFHITNILTIVAALAVAWGIFVHGRKYAPETNLIRRSAATIFTLWAAQRASNFSIIWPQGIEIFATLPLVTLSILMITSTMFSTAFMGRRYHKNFSLWILMLFTPGVWLFTHALMKFSDNYRPLFTYEHFVHFRSSTPIIFYGRAVFLAMLFIFWILAAGMMIDAVVRYRRMCATRVLDENTEQNDGKVKLSLIWYALVVAALLPMLSASLVPHVIFNILIVTALFYTALRYKRHIKFLQERDSGKLAYLQISRRVPMLLGMERGGLTSWGTVVAQNPFFNSNSTIEDMAQALGVRDAMLSNYIQQSGTNFAAWVSDLRIRYSADLLTSTDRKINEIAHACGYKDLPNFTRAFKRQYQLSPSDYRKENTAN